MFKESSGTAAEPQERTSGKWTVCSPETVGGFTATGYFFGREIHQKRAVPVGLINSSVGGTPIESWTSMAAMKDKPEFKPLFDSWEQRTASYDPEKAKAQYEKQLAAFKAAQKDPKQKGKRRRGPRKPQDPKLHTHHPGNLFNGKIAPLIPYAIRGAIWYQGEANAKSDESSRLYATQLPLMIQDWRTRWKQGDFPFAWVQLPNFKKRNEDPGAPSAWAAMRESMMKSLAVKNTGMAITIDVGEAGNIHPKDKQAVGKRLSMWAMAKVYGQQGASSGPLPKGHKIDGDKVTVTFTHTDGGLVAKEGDLKGFALAGADKKWHWASAKIEGEAVVVSCPEVKQPVSVRYAWGDNPDCNLFNGAGLPASPFRTDE
jgi:sialate O-acetylesterase